MAITVNHLCGGLGNQMFQYAMGRAFSLRHNCELKFDLSWFENYGGAIPRPFLLSSFGIPIAEASSQEVTSLKYKPQSLLRRLFKRPKQNAMTFIKEPHFHYWAHVEQLFPPIYLEGYWQTEKYFANHVETIKKDFSFPPLPRETAEEIMPLFGKEKQTVAIHIRRGDYVENLHTNTVHGVCSANYYNQAVTALTAQYGKDLHLLLFSDDPLWVINHFDCQGLPSSVINFPAHVEAPYHDMHLMTLCNHHIIANSSFSWWGAWLAKKEGMRIAPNRWFAISTREYDNPCPHNWITR